MKFRESSSIGIVCHGYLFSWKQFLKFRPDRDIMIAHVIRMQNVFAFPVYASRDAETYAGYFVDPKTRARGHYFRVLLNCLAKLPAWFLIKKKCGSGLDNGLVPGKIYKAQLDVSAAYVYAYVLHVLLLTSANDTQLSVPFRTNYYLYFIIAMV